MIASDWGVSMGEQVGGAVPCQGLGAIFFSDDPQVVEQAQAICGPCKRSASCLSGALERGEAYGVWGGAIVRFGKVLDAAPRRGRPRKAA